MTAGLARDRAAVDAVVVGAGLAGLAAARELEAVGASVVVVEADGRVGGRTLTEPVGGVSVEMGGQWIGPAQPRILALARNLGIETFSTDVPGRTVLYENVRRSEYEEDAEVPFEDPGAYSDVQRVFLALSELAGDVPGDAPWEARRAAEYDGQTLESWKLANTSTGSARFHFDLAVRSLYACEPRDISLLGVLSDVAASDGRGGLFEIEASAEELRFFGGAQELSVRMAEDLEGRMILDSPVRRIFQDNAWVRVESDAMTVEADHAIVTVPPVLRGRIAYEPGLPPVHDGLSQRLPMGAVIKCHAVYERPFWREKGLNGRAESDAGPCGVTCDNSTPGEDAGVLTGFILVSEARVWGRKPAAERERAVISSFARFFGDEALEPLGYAECDWGAEPYARGGYAGVPVPGFFTDHGAALQEPFGRVHWAGTETAAVWTGYMEGAIESGIRAAREVLAASGETEGDLVRERRPAETGTGG